MCNVFGCAPLLSRATQVAVAGCSWQVTDLNGEVGQKPLMLKLKVCGKEKLGNSKQVTDASGKAGQELLRLKLKVSGKGKLGRSRQVTDVSCEGGQKLLGLKVRPKGKPGPLKAGQRCERRILEKAARVEINGKW
ncbi:hypothetical protein NDU88_004956 [Pleurodeles waltl]|uniref:Uncharacterized protein n=1 Tax=Pleurodeles waltl TaxID=8319 RepID=A0AAV7WAE8_PLEWA|nr:hypothetical protein NDU88_004956 [Pleurodeles waltl]